ncbi:PIN domain-containing protein [Endothiovibrio diazotrophicus]
MIYLLDTCVLSDFVRGEPGTLARLKSHSPDDLSFSTITLFELEYGLLFNPERAGKIETPLRQVIGAIAPLPFCEDDAREAARIRAQLKRDGTPIGAYDLLLAGCARHRGLTLVSANQREFERVTGLRHENWRAPSSLNTQH